MRYIVSIVAAGLLSACVDGGDYNSFRSSFDDTPEVFTANSSIAVPEITAGTKLPFGVVSKECSVSRSQMGTAIAKFPEDRPAYTLYDTKPGSSSARTLYLTGFKDGCPRQFTGAMAVFGDAQIYEQINYGAPAKTQKRSKTDIAYDRLKASVCGVSANRPCGDKISRLENNTVFMSVYKSFGGNRQWVNVLMHKGKILAVDEKSG